MNLTLRFAALLSLSSVLGFAESWSGGLVDAKFYVTLPHNVSHGHPGSKARELVLKEGNKSPLAVSVTGDKTEDTHKVNTISVSK